MNGQQQKERRTAVARLDNEIIALADRFDEELGNARAESRDAVGAERTHRLTLADEQRAYVDLENKITRGQFAAFRERGFWSRLNWLVTGR